MFRRRGIRQVFHGDPCRRQGCQIHPVSQVPLPQFAGIGLIDQQDGGIVESTDPQILRIPQLYRQPVSRLGLDRLERTLRRQLLQPVRSRQDDIGLGGSLSFFATRTASLSFLSRRLL
jgi:hypothetical protein